MIKNTILTAGQIRQLRAQVIKILEENVISFSTKVAVNTELTKIEDGHTLYEFCQSEYTRLQKTLDNLSQFTFMVMSNFQMVWEQVQHRQNKILELRQSFSSATNYMQELKYENQAIKQRLTEAETYIQWIEQQKQYLDTIYSDRSTLTINSREQSLSKCISERSLRWNDDKKQKNVNYERLKEYVQALKEQRNQIEKQLFNLTKRYQMKSQQCKRANFFIGHLVDRLNRKNQLKQYVDTLNNYETRQQSSKTQLTTDDILKLLQKTESLTSTSLQKNLNLLQQGQDQKKICHYFDSFTNLQQSSPLKEYPSYHNLSFFSPTRQFKDAMIQTDDMVIRKDVACQVHSQTSQIQNKEKDYTISIQISGSSKVIQRQKEIASIIENLHLQNQIENTLKKKCKSPLQIKNNTPNQKKNIQDKLSTFNKGLFSACEYYHNRFVLNRIKKYHYSKPQSQLISKCLKIK